MFIWPPFKGGHMFHRLARAHTRTHRHSYEKVGQQILRFTEVDGHVTYCVLNSLLLICHPYQYFLYKLTTSSSIYLYVARLSSISRRYL